MDRVFHSASFHNTRLIYRPQCPFCRAKIISFEPIDFSTYKGACKWGSGSSRAVVHALVLGNRETAVQCRISASHHAPLLCTLSVCLSLRVSECVVSVISLFIPSLSSNLSPTLSLTQSNRMSPSPPPSNSLPKKQPLRSPRPPSQHRSPRSNCRHPRARRAAGRRRRRRSAPRRRLPPPARGLLLF